MQDSNDYSDQLDALREEVCELHREYETAEQEYNEMRSSTSKQNLKNAFKKLEDKRTEFNNLCMKQHRLLRQR